MDCFFYVHLGMLRRLRDPVSVGSHSHRMGKNSSAGFSILNAIAAERGGAVLGHGATASVQPGTDRRPIRHRVFFVKRRKCWKAICISLLIFRRTVSNDMKMAMESDTHPHQSTEPSACWIAPTDLGWLV